LSGHIVGLTSTKEVREVGKRDGRSIARLVVSLLQAFGHRQSIVSAISSNFTAGTLNITYTL
jgi:hypothetical protein